MQEFICSGQKLFLSYSYFGDLMYANRTNRLAYVYAFTYYNSQRESRSLQEVHATQRKRMPDINECLSRDERDEYWYPYKLL